jgi:hypothetical protein
MGKQWLEHSFGDRAMTLAAVHPGYDLYEPKSAACQLNISVSFLKDSVKNDPSAPVILGWGLIARNTPALQVWWDGKRGITEQGGTKTQAIFSSAFVGGV